MQDMIKRIVEADNKAKQLDEANRKAAEREKQKIEEEAEAIYREAMDNAREEVKKTNAYIDKRTERKINDIKAKQESVSIKLKSEYEHNCSRWVDEIVSRVLE